MRSQTKAELTISQFTSDNSGLHVGWQNALSRIVLWSIAYVMKTANKPVITSAIKAVKNSLNFCRLSHHRVVPSPIAAFGVHAALRVAHAGTRFGNWQRCHSKYPVRFRLGKILCKTGIVDRYCSMR
jgi:hypothetical protein